MPPRLSATQHALLGSDHLTGTTLQIPAGLTLVSPLFLMLVRCEGEGELLRTVFASASIRTLVYSLFSCHAGRTCLMFLVTRVV